MNNILEAGDFIEKLAKHMNNILEAGDFIEKSY